MGNFNNVTMGSGVLRYDGRDVGFLRGDVSYEYNYDIEYFKSGVPLKTYGSITKEVTARLTAPLAEITVENLAMASGGLTINTVAGTAITSTVTKALAAYPSSPGVQAITLDAQNVSSGVGGLVVTSGAVTGTVNDDYIVDYANGVVFWNPGGAFTSGASLTAVFTATPPASKSLYLGSRFSLDQKSIEFVHTSPVTGKTKKIMFWKASTNGQVKLPFAESAFIVNEIIFEGIWDDTHPTNPLGYFEEQT